MLVRASAIFDKVSGFPKDDTTGWHNNFDQYALHPSDVWLNYSPFSAKQCHGKALPHNLNGTSIRVTQEDVRKTLSPFLPLIYYHT